MRYPQIKIFGYSEAAMYLRKTPPPEVTAMISIHGAREFGVEASVEHRLDLAFDDVEAPDPNDMLSIQRATSRKRWAQQNGLSEVVPTASDVASIIGFAETTRHLDGILLCHCGGGMSRAPAAALICLSVWCGAGSERECVAEIRRRRQGAVPHAGLVRIADKALSRNGAMIAAIVAATHAGL